MYENPLLPNRKLQELYALMQRMRAMTRREPAMRGLEAILAASLMQVEPGDFVASFPGLSAAATIAKERTSINQIPSPAPLPKTLRLAVAAGIAQGLLLAKNARLSICFTTAGSVESCWQEALTYASTARLPLIVVCADSTTGSTRKPPLPAAFTSANMLKMAAPLHLPVLSVDGADAVAVYRVMQESVLRGRTLGGTAVIWCSLPSPSAGKSAAAAPDPLQHMRRYLADRKLLTPKSKTSATRKH